MKQFCAVAALAAACLLAAGRARANVYATDIYVNGDLTNAAGTVGTALTVSYRLNESDATNVTVSFVQSGSVKGSVAGGTNRGLNTISWTPTNTGAFTVSITAAAAGFKVWTQTSADTNVGNYAFAPAGIAVDCNTNSPYYGRVLLGCAGAGSIGTNKYLDGIYKLNADASYADEGGFGYGGYTNDDAGNVSVGEMPAASQLVPLLLRVGADDRVYMEDYSSYGAIISFDMLVKSNLVVIDDGGALGGHLGGFSTYANNPDLAYLYADGLEGYGQNIGITSFDVTGGGTASPAVWLGDGDSPGWGVWVYYMTNEVADPNDSIGIQAIESGPGSLWLNSGGGLMVDTNQDIFLSQFDNSAINGYVQMEWPNWDSGALPPEGLDTNAFNAESYATGTGPGGTAWGVGTNDATDTGVFDTVIDSRTHPKYVATPLNDGVRVLYAATGLTVTATNGATVQSLANLGSPAGYTCAAWDNVGNLYAAADSPPRWRVWSPPGGNTNTTVSVAVLTVSEPSGPPIPFTITNILASAVTGGSRTVTLKFSAPIAYTASAFTLLGATNVNGPYTTIPSATITGGSGAFQAVATTGGAAEFFKIEE